VASTSPAIHGNPSALDRQWVYRGFRRSTAGLVSDRGNATRSSFSGGVRIKGWDRCAMLVQLQFHRLLQGPDTAVMHIRRREGIDITVQPRDKGISGVTKL
jgi:hypothetical protein